MRKKYEDMTPRERARAKVYDDHYREMYGGEIWTEEEVEQFRQEVTSVRQNAERVRAELRLGLPV